MRLRKRWLVFRRGAWLFVGLVVCFTTASAQTEYRSEIFGSIGMSESLAILRPPDRRVNVGGGVRTIRNAQGRWACFWFRSQLALGRAVGLLSIT